MEGEGNGQSKLIAKLIPDSAMTMCAKTMSMRVDEPPVQSVPLEAQSARYAIHGGHVAVVAQLPDGRLDVARY